MARIWYRLQPCNFYENVSQAEVERFYARMKEEGNEQAPSYGLNSKLTKRNGELVELKWTGDGLYGQLSGDCFLVAPCSEICRK